LPKLRSVLRDPHDDHARLVLLNVPEDGNVYHFSMEYHALF
jgi:hypothetical protein